MVVLLLLPLLLQVILCGDSGVGKTCLIERMFSNKFDPTLPSTIGKAQIVEQLRCNSLTQH
jgi:GTPase SAR1 family protein